MPKVRTAPDMIPHTPFEVYKEKYKERFFLERSESGVLVAKWHTKGDSLVWECEIQNDTDAVVGDGGPGAGQQMCYVFGNFIPDGPAPEGNWGCLPREAPPF